MGNKLSIFKHTCIRYMFNVYLYLLHFSFHCNFFGIAFALNAEIKNPALQQAA